MNKYQIVTLLLLIGLHSLRASEGNPFFEEPLLEMSTTIITQGLNENSKRPVTDLKNYSQTHKRKTNKIITVDKLPDFNKNHGDLEDLAEFLSQGYYKIQLPSPEDDIIYESVRRLQYLCDTDVIDGRKINYELYFLMGQMDFLRPYQKNIDSDGSSSCETDDPVDNDSATDSKADVISEGENIGE